MRSRAPLPTFTCACALVIVGVFAVTTSRAATIHVPQDAPTIQSGIDVAQPGDVVLVACGTYLEHDIVMKSGVRLLAEQPGCAVIDAEQLGRVIACTGVDGSASIEGFVLTNGLLTGYDIAHRGAALSLWNSSPAVIGCSFLDNHADAGGGGIFAVRTESRIEDCVFARNGGVDGGGVYLDYASPTMRGCTFHDNTALFWGGAIFCENESSPLIEHCTIVRNDAYEGGGIWCVNESHARIENSIVAYSLGGDGIFAYHDPGHDSNVTVACSDAFANVEENYGGTLEDQTGLNGNISADPMFCDPANDDFRLAGSSPCLPQNNDCGVLMGAKGAGCDLVGFDDSVLREASGLRSRPNPCSSGCALSFRTERAGSVRLTIHDAAGRFVRELRGGDVLPAGTHEVRWDGMDAQGRSMPAGVYLCRLRTEAAFATTAIVRMP